MIRFLRHRIPKNQGFRLQYLPHKFVQNSCEDYGALILNLLDLDTRIWQDGVKAIWSSGKIRIVDESFTPNEHEFLIEIAEIKKRKRGERI